MVNPQLLEAEEGVGHVNDMVRMNEFARNPAGRSAAGVFEQLKELVASLPETIDDAVRETYRLQDVLRARASRGKFFNPRLFADPAWDMLLDLYAAHVSQRRVSVSSLATAANVPPTTALRWMDTLRKEGLIDRHPDPLDGRRIFVELSDKGIQAMSDYLQSLPVGLRPL